MGTARAPDVGSGVCPPWSAMVSGRSFRSLIVVLYKTHCLAQQTRREPRFDLPAGASRERPSPGANRVIYAVLSPPDMRPRLRGVQWKSVKRDRLRRAASTSLMG